MARKFRRTNLIEDRPTEPTAPLPEVGELRGIPPPPVAPFASRLRRPMTVQSIENTIRENVIMDNVYENIGSTISPSIDIVDITQRFRQDQATYRDFYPSDRIIRTNQELVLAHNLITNLFQNDAILRYLESQENQE